MNRKIDAMYERFGKYGVGQCRDCRHFKKGKYHGRILRKCDVYGMTHSEATDWSGKYAACGLYNKPYKGTTIIELLKHEPRRGMHGEQEVPIEGQMDLFAEEST